MLHVNVKAKGAKSMREQFSKKSNHNGLRSYSRTPGLGSSESSVSDSWARCTSFGLNPTSKPIDAVTSGTELLEIRQKNDKIRQFVIPELQLLYNQIAGTKFMVAYADNTGVVLDAYLDEDFKQSDAGKAVIPGSVWTENYRGTNALGLALHTGKSQIVAGSDHFFRKLGNLSCFAAPIYGQDDDIVGLIDATSDASSRQQHTLALVKLASKNVENRLFIDQFSDSIILVFHARHEYLSTTSAAMLAVDEHGFVEGANQNAKIMLNGLSLSNKQHFGDIFCVPFSNIANRLNSNEIVRIQDVMGSVVFMSMKKSSAKRIVNIPTKSSIDTNLQRMPKNIHRESNEFVEGTQHLPLYVSDDPVLKRYLSLAENALIHRLPVLVEGHRGSGKRTTAIELGKRVFPSKPCIEIDCSHLTDNNFETVLFGSLGKPAFFDEALPAQPLGKLSLVQGGLIIFKNIDALSKIIQCEISKLIELYLHSNEDFTLRPIGGFVFTCTQPMEVLKSGNNMSEVFLESLIGAHLQLPNLDMRTDFEKITKELLAQVSPKHHISKNALDALCSRDWPGHLGQLKKVLRVLVSTSDTHVIRNASIQHDQKLSGVEIGPCDACSNSPIRKENCTLIRKSWLDTGQNISLASRRLGVSRNTVYRHIKNM